MLPCPAYDVFIYLSLSAAPIDCLDKHQRPESLLHAPSQPRHIRSTNADQIHGILARAKALGSYGLKVLTAEPLDSRGVQGPYSRTTGDTLTPQYLDTLTPNVFIA